MHGAFMHKSMGLVVQMTYVHAKGFWYKSFFSSFQVLTSLVSQVELLTWDSLKVRLHFSPEF